jgi:hypothetical protein
MWAIHRLQPPDAGLEFYFDRGKLNHIETGVKAYQASLAENHAKLNLEFEF